MAYQPTVTSTLFAIAASLALAPPPAHAGAIQLASPSQLGRHVAIVTHTATVDLLPSPLVVTTSDNVVTFTLAVGEWRRLDEGVNVLSDFAPGTHLLYTNNNNGNDLQGQGNVGGGGSGPAAITFDNGVRAVGFRAEMQVLGPETLTFSAFNEQTLLGTFAVSRINGQHQDDSASFLGVRATDGDVITRLTLSGVATQNGVAHENDFFLGPVSYVPEPSGLALLCLAGSGVALRMRRRLAQLRRRDARQAG